MSRRHPATQDAADAVLSVLAGIFIGSPLRSLTVTREEFRHASPSPSSMQSTHLAPLVVLRQLRALRLDDVSFSDIVDGPTLATMLAGLTELTCLELAAKSTPEERSTWACRVVVAVCWLTRLESLRLHGNSLTNISQLPDHVGAMSQLRCLDIRGCRVWAVSPAVCQLTRLEVLSLLSSGRRDTTQQPAYPLPVDGIGALVRLRELRVSFHYQPVQPLASPSLEVLELEVCPTPELTAGPSTNWHTHMLSFTCVRPHIAVCRSAARPLDCTYGSDVTAILRLCPCIRPCCSPGHFCPLVPMLHVHAVLGVLVGPHKWSPAY
jgi:hypothetical protein